MRLYNTLSREVEDFTPIDERNVRLFVCGPTVYGPMHLGHAKTYTQFDLLAKVLRREYPSLRYAMNITDLDDKLLVRGAREGRDWKELAEAEENRFWDAMERLGNDEVDETYRATDFIAEVISQVARMLTLGKAYEIPHDGIYFDLSTFPSAGNLARRAQTGEEQSRLGATEKKRNPGDFVVWKFAKEDEPAWEADFGLGRPGWHIEDTAITESVFGPSYDIHGGATDLIFPHHEAEIAQMESISGQPLVRYWAHTGLLNIGGRKMGKSEHNFTTVMDLLDAHEWRTIRYAILSTHYRSTMDFTVGSDEQADTLEAALAARRRVEEAYRSSAPAGPAGEIFEAFYRELLDDLNTPRALASLFTALRSASVTRGDLEAVNEVLGGVFELVLPEAPREVVDLAHQRQALRLAKAWEESDRVREAIRTLGWEVRDSAEGFTLAPRGESP